MSSQERSSADSSPSGPVENIPRRLSGSKFKFFLYLFLLPTLGTVAFTTFAGYLMFPDFPGDWSWYNIGKHLGLHTATLLSFLVLMWIPQFLAVTNWADKVEDTIYYLRTIIAISLIYMIVPYKVTEHFFEHTTLMSPTFISHSIFGILALGVFILSIVQLKTSAYRDIQAGKEPRERRYTQKMILFDGMKILLLLLVVFLMELWFFLSLKNPQFVLYPDQYLVNWLEEANNHWREALNIPMLKVTACIGASLLSGLFFFLTSCLVNRLMRTVMLSVTFHERNIKRILKNSTRYFFHFASAQLLKHPFLIFAGGIFTFTTFLLPLSLFALDKKDYLNMLIGPDQLIWSLGIFAAWFSPILGGILHPDQTYGEHFNKKLANFLMMVQGHVVVFGFGNLGKRVTTREIRKMYLEHFFKLPSETRISTSGLKRRFFPKKYFMEVVTPDVTIEYMCTHLVVVERNPQDIVYSTENELLGPYGVVSVDTPRLGRIAEQNNAQSLMNGVLVPVIMGEAKEPFISSRVNMERAILVISTIPEEEAVQTIFDRASRNNIKSIISVSRSDQIAYLTYRARHRRIVLVYPKHNQGTILGYRLWAAMLKVRALNQRLPETSTTSLKRNKVFPHWPNVLVVGNSKSYRFMIETLWAHLPGNHDDKMKFVQHKFAFIVTNPNDSPGHPELKEKLAGFAPPYRSAFDMYWPESFLSSGRFPYPVGKGDLIDMNLDTRRINSADTRAIIECLHDFRPQILIINHDDFQQTALMLIRCMRALEKLRAKFDDQFRLPMILLSAAQGNEREQIVLGDAASYYDALAKLYQEPLSFDFSYPSASRFDHYLREAIGETISDSLAEAEEIISGARRSFAEEEESFSQVDEAKPKKRFKGLFRLQPAKVAPKKRFIEITSCLPNTPGSLISYLSEFAGIKFAKLEWEMFQKIWSEGKDDWETHYSQSLVDNPHLPSFQHLRHIKLGDLEKKGFAISGYAALMPMEENSPYFKEISDSPVNYPVSNPAGEPDTEEKKYSKVVRIFANDGQSHIEDNIDPAEGFGEVEKDYITKRLKSHKTPSSPGVPEVIDRVTARESNGAANSLGEYTKVMLDRQPDGSTGKYACPGMNICRIAAFQDYVTGSNNLRLSGVQTPSHESPNEGTPNKLGHAKNYYCSTSRQTWADDNIVPNENANYARIFCCSHGPRQPGMIARVLNLLYFKKATTLLFQNETQNNWLINLDYFSHMTCQNSHFTLNRLFGSFANQFKQGFNVIKGKDPIHLIRILPIGGVESSKLWYNYAYALLQYLNNKATPDKPASHSDNAEEQGTSNNSAGKNNYLFYWMDDKRKIRKEDDIPCFDVKNNCDFPILMVIKKVAPQEESRLARGMCRICGLQKEEVDCRKFRAWV